MRGVSEVLRKMEEKEKRDIAALYAIAERISKEMEAYAKENAVWTDRTSNARQGLQGRARLDTDTVYAVIAHSVEYGKWLEIAHEEKYAILKQTINTHFDEFLKQAKKVADGKITASTKLNTNFFS